MRVAQLVRALLCGAALVCISNISVAQQNEIFDDLIKNGVTLSDGTKGELPKVVMEDGLNAAAQEKVIQGIVEDPKRLASFRSAGPNDWFELKKIGGKPATAEKPSSARNLDLYYMANGRLETIADKGFIKGAMGGGGNNFHILTEQELKDLGIELPKDAPTKRERYAHAKMDLFNMAVVDGTGQGISVQNKDSVVIAFRLDPKFKGDKKFPNEWKGITRDASGQKVETPAQPYEGAGGYMKITRVVGSPKPQVFIEYHLVFDEPFGWFQGKPVLTSKLPTKIDADVKSFRRDINKFEKENPPKPAGAQANAAEAGAKK